MISGSPVKPRIANMAASIPPRAALPECSALVIVPMLRRKPAELAVAIPIARAVCSVSAPLSRQAANAAATGPMRPTCHQPRYVGP